jgi:threonine dehydrogenase-like Zn-dependent dehydrogenase
VFEASGNVHAVPQGIQMLRNRGVYLVPGQYSASGGVMFNPELITFKAIQIIGSSQYSVSDVISYLEFLEENPGLHPVIDSMITEYPVSKVNEAFEDIKAAKNIKTILVGE